MSKRTWRWWIGPTVNSVLTVGIGMAMGSPFTGVFVGVVGFAVGYVDGKGVFGE